MAFSDLSGGQNGGPSSKKWTRNFGACLWDPGSHSPQDCCSTADLLCLRDKRLGCRRRDRISAKERFEQDRVVKSSQSMVRAFRKEDIGASKMASPRAKSDCSGRRDTVRQRASPTVECASAGV